MDASFFIARKLTAKGRIASVCIAVSFFIIIIAVAVSSGFRSEIRNGVSTISGDVQITPINQDFLSGDTSIPRNPAWLSSLSSLPEVESVNPVVYRAGIVKNGGNIHGILFKGMEGFCPDTSSVMGVSIPSKLSGMLGLKEGDTMLSYFVGEKLKVRKFTVTSIYNGILDSDDKLVAFVDIADLQRLNGWEEDEVSAFEISAIPSCKTETALKELESKVGFMTYTDDDDESVYSCSSVTKYPQLFDWLSLIDFNVAFILLLMIIVAGFNMISGLLIMLFENISTIGLLKSLGMRDKAIAKVFLISSSRLVLKGMIAGNLLALAFCFIQGTTHLMKLDPENYFISFVPVDVNMLSVVSSDLIAFAAIMLLLLIPSMFITKVDPADTVRVE